MLDMANVKIGLHWLPIILFILFPVTFLGTYAAAVLQGHVEPAFPYISDSGTYSPESCVFGQLINIACVLRFQLHFAFNCSIQLVFVLLLFVAAHICFDFVLFWCFWAAYFSSFRDWLLLVGLVVYVRYRQILEIIRCNPNLKPQLEKLNKRTVWVGYTSTLGLSMVANFQETNVLYVHFAGALLCFGVGTGYFWAQTICSYRLLPYAGSPTTAHVRLGLSILSCIFFIATSITGIMSYAEFDGENSRKWYPTDGGWELHVCSTASEWVVAICFCLSILSFSNEFKHISFDHPQICLTASQETNSVVDPEVGNINIENGKTLAS